MNMKSTCKIVFRWQTQVDKDSLSKGIKMGLIVIMSQVQQPSLLKPRDKKFHSKLSKSRDNIQYTDYTIYIQAIVEKSMILEYGV